MFFKAFSTFAVKRVYTADLRETVYNNILIDRIIIVFTFHKFAPPDIGAYKIMWCFLQLQHQGPVVLSLYFTLLKD